SGADVETTFYKCCEEGNMWATSASSCDGLAKEALASSFPEEQRSSCTITMEICCRATMRERFCEAGKAAARRNNVCETPEDTCPGDTYRDCCEGCRLGLAAAKLGTSCEFETFSLGSPWDDAFQHCCSGKEEQSEDGPPNHENEESHKVWSYRTMGSCKSFEAVSYIDVYVPVIAAKPADGHLCEQYNPCEHKCRNSGTTLVCECYEGYRLEEDDKSCADVDECADGTHNCDLTTHQCMNKPGGFGCIPKSDAFHPSVGGGTPPQCEAGFKYNSAMKDCIDVDECSEGLDDCAMDQETCLNTYGAFQCLSKESKECPAGYKWDQDACVDVNECAESVDACDARFEEVCKNTVGGYVCNPICSEGHRYSHHFEKCLDIDECQEGTHTCGSARLCANTEGGFTCRTAEQCQEGFRYNRITGKCEDIDECQERTHDCNPQSQACINVNGSFSCRNKIRCPVGYRLNENTRSCIDIDECLHGLHSCSSRDTKCVNSVGSYRCIKKSLYYSCPRGFMYSSRLKGCEDIDECAEGLDGCQEDQACVNAVGSFSCVPRSPQSRCPRGHRKNPVTRRCEDIDECQEYTHTCFGDMVCINTEGSYLCEKRQPVNPGVKSNGHSGGQHGGSAHLGRCKTGQRRDPLTGDCRDINECDAQRPCAENEVCQDLIGRYKCVCKDGYQRDSDTSPCKDINECQYGGHNCQIGFRCDNTPGSFTCVRSSGCGTGYTVNFVSGQCEGGLCQHGHHGLNFCFPCLGVCQYDIYSLYLFPWPGKICARGTSLLLTRLSSRFSDINECRNRSICGRYYRCVNTVGSYHCESLISCSPGYEPNQNQYIDECALGTHDCKSDQTCDNRPGSFVCECPIGFRLNSFRECEDIDECTRFRGKVCSINSDCTNTPGSYTCECKEGFQRGADPRSCI
ncbi:unnamed protein product, partial [Ixodes hexagonus]